MGPQECRRHPWGCRAPLGSLSYRVDHQVGHRLTIERLLDEFDPPYRVKKGFRDLSIIGDGTSGEYGSSSVWDSKDDAEAANAVIAPRLQEALKGLLQGPSEARSLRCLNPTVAEPPLTIDYLDERRAGA